MNENLYTKLIYKNKFSELEDIKDFILEGSAEFSFPNDRLRMQNSLDPSLGQKSNFVFWCPVEFPSNIKVTWDFYPIKEPGLCMIMFTARGINGKDIFDESLQKRNGEYFYYNNGDINTLHLAYFRRKAESERAFHLCNLRKSKGFHLVSQGADPIPNVEDCISPYKIKLIKYENEVAFYINDLKILHWIDDCETYGPAYGGGKIGFRQMAPLVAEYQNLEIYTTE